MALKVLLKIKISWPKPFRLMPEKRVLGALSFSKHDEKDMIATGRWVSQIQKTAKRIGLKLDSTLEPFG